MVCILLRIIGSSSVFYKANTKQTAINPDIDLISLSGMRRGNHFLCLALAVQPSVAGVDSYFCPLIRTRQDIV